MKLKNKKTGEIINNNGISFAEGNYKTYSSLAELNDEWQDYEEPKKYWFIDAFGNIVQNEITKHYGDEYTDLTNAYENQKQIGNYFETKEEAELAVRKLKAWKRLKDKGFRFYDGDDACISYLLDPIKWDDELEKDFDLLFGGEE